MASQIPYLKIISDLRIWVLRNDIKRVRTTLQVAVDAKHYAKGDPFNTGLEDCLKASDETIIDQVLQLDGMLSEASNEDWYYSIPYSKHHALQEDAEKESDNELDESSWECDMCGEWYLGDEESYVDEANDSVLCEECYADLEDADNDYVYRCTECGEECDLDKDIDSSEEIVNGNMTVDNSTALDRDSSRSEGKCPECGGALICIDLDPIEKSIERKQTNYTKHAPIITKSSDDPTEAQTCEAVKEVEKRLLYLSNDEASQDKVQNMSYDPDLFEILRSVRNILASAEGSPVYTVLSDKTIVELAILKPRTHEELRSVYGFDSGKIDKYGDQVLRVIIKYCESEDSSQDCC